MYGDEGGEYGQEERDYFAVPDMHVDMAPGAPSAPAPASPAQPFKGNPVPSKMRLATLRHNTRFGGLGDFSPEGVCAVNALAKLIWRFFSQVNDGTTLDALATLNVYRSLYNYNRALLAPGFTPAAAAALPASLPDAAWTADVRTSTELVLVGALGSSDSALVSAISAMPTSMAQLPNWWTGLSRSASLNASDLAALRTYIEIPMPRSADPATILAAYVADDLRACATGAPAPGPTPTQQGYSAPTPQQTAQTIRCSDGSIVPVGTPCPPPPGSSSPGGGNPGGGGGGGSAPARGVGMMGLVLGALALYGLYLAVQDGKKTPAQLRGEVDEDDFEVLEEEAAETGAAAVT